MRSLFVLLLWLLVWPGPVLGRNIYVSAVHGSDEGDGSAASPYATIHKALATAVPGDVVLLTDGVFREEVVITVSDITLRATGEDVTITGTDLVSGWETDNDTLYWACVSQKVGQLFMDGIPQVRAKFPNQEVDTDLFHFTTLHGERTSSFLTSDAFTQPSGFFDGATVWMLLGKRWVALTAHVDRYAGGRMELSNISASYEGSGIFFVSNCRNCLDHDGEWYWENDTLYYWNSRIDPREHRMEAKVRDRIIHVNGASRVIIDGVDGFAGSVILGETRECKLLRGTFRYLTDYDYLGESRTYMRLSYLKPTSYGVGIGLFGVRDTIAYCHVAWSAGDAITLYGDSSVVYRCTVHDANYRATDASVISIGGRGVSILRSDLFNAGRDLITNGDAKGFRIMYNRLHTIALLAWDVGIFYSWGKDGGNGEIAFNHIYDAYSGNPDPSWGAVGVYLDNGSRNFLVHHNVIHDIKGMGIQYNYPGYNLRSYHNTVYNTTIEMRAVGDDVPGVTPGECRLYNNYTDRRLLDVYWTDLKNNWVSGLDYLQGRDTGNFLPLEGSVLVDHGIFVDEIREIPYSGDGPDIGAYELGLEPWDVGPASTAEVKNEHLTLRDTAGNLLRGTPMFLAAELPEDLQFALDPENWLRLRRNGLNTVRLCWADPWYAHQGKAHWTVEEVLPYLDSCVANARRTGMNVIITYYDPGAQDLYDTAFSFSKETVFWEKVAPRYAELDHVSYELADAPVNIAEKYTVQDFREGYLQLYNEVRTWAPMREVLMFSFGETEKKIVGVVEEYAGSLAWDHTTVAYHLKGTVTTAPVLSVMANRRAICTRWDYPWKEGNIPVDGCRQNVQALERIGASWIDWRDPADTLLDEYMDSLLFDAHREGYWWGMPVDTIAMERVNLLQDTVHLVAGLSVRLEALVMPALSRDPGIVWYTSDPGMLDVDNTGRITAHYIVNGDTLVVYAKAASGCCSDSCLVIIEPSPDKCAYPDCVPHPIPGEINPTWFDNGGEGISYHDLSPGNAGNGPRQDEDVDTEYRLEGGSIGGIESGEWLDYTIHAEENGHYQISILFAATSRYGRFHIEVDGRDVTGMVYVNASGSYNSFKATEAGTVYLEAGDHLMRIVFDYAYYNMGTITISRVTGTEPGVTAEKNYVSVFPNPVSEKLFFVSRVPVDHYVIFDITGMVVMKGTLYGRESILDVSRLEQGCFLIVLYQRKKVVLRTKIVKLEE